MGIGRVAAVMAALGLGVSLMACRASGDKTSVSSPRPTPDAGEATPAAEGQASPGPTATSSSRSAGNAGAVVGTVVHFRGGSTVVRATIEEDTATTRDFISRLPMTLRFEDFGGREKVATPPRPFDYRGTTGMTPQDGDLFSYRPWGNLGFFYDADGLGHSDELVRIGTTADLEEIRELDGKQVTIAISE